MLIYPSVDKVLLYSSSGTANQSGYSFQFSQVSVLKQPARCHMHVFFFTILNGLLSFIIENLIVTLVLRISAEDFKIRSNVKFSLSEKLIYSFSI